jgi:hypothetical protein
LPNSVWRNYQLQQIQSLIKDAAGIFIEASTQKAQVIPGENLGLQVMINQRSSANAQLVKLQLPSKDSLIQKTLGNNQNTIIDYTFKVAASTPISQPYWLVQPKTEGMFIVNDYSFIGKAENDPAFSITAQLNIEGVDFYFPQAIQYKYTDPTKGDVFAFLIHVDFCIVAP